MKRHPFDPLSFVFGVVFVALAGALSIQGIDFDTWGLRWIGAGALLLFGVLMLITSKTGTPAEPTEDRS